MLVNSVQVPDSDIMATNGVIHMINQVLYPGGKNVMLFILLILLTTWRDVISALQI